MLLPVWSIAEFPTGFLTFPDSLSHAPIGMFGDEQERVLMPAHTGLSTTVGAEGLRALSGEEQPVAIPYTILYVPAMEVMGTTEPPDYLLAVCEDPEQEFGEAEMFLVNQFLWETSSKPALKIVGVTRDPAGAILGGAVVHLFRTDEDLILEREISDPATGAYSVSVFDSGFYYVASAREQTFDTTMLTLDSGLVKLDAAGQVTGLSVNTLQGS